MGAVLHPRTLWGLSGLVSRSPKAHRAGEWLTAGRRTEGCLGESREKGVRDGRRTLSALPPLPYRVPSALTTQLPPAQGTCLSQGLQVLGTNLLSSTQPQERVGWGPDSWELQAWAPPPDLRPFCSLPSRVGRAGQKVIHQQAGCLPKKRQSPTGLSICSAPGHLFLFEWWDLRVISVIGGIIGGIVEEDPSPNPAVSGEQALGMEAAGISMGPSWAQL